MSKALFLRAVKDGNTPEVRRLLVLDPSVLMQGVEKDADVDDSCRKPRSAIEIATQEGNIEMVNFLYEHGVPIDASHWWESNSPSMIEWFLRHGANPNVSIHHGGETALLRSCSFGGQIQIQRLLLDFGANPNQTDDEEEEAPLARACRFHQRMETLRLLVDRGAHIDAANKQGFTALFRAVEEGRSDVVLWLLEQGADVNHRDTRGGTVLLRAIEWREKTIVDVLLELPQVLVDIQDDRGETPLSRALTNGWTKYVCWLLEKGANPNTCNADGVCPLLRSIGNADSTRRLLNQGANVNVSNRFGVSPLSKAIDRDQIKVAFWLLENKANVNTQTNKDGETPLLRAIQRNHLDIVQHLLDNKADANMTNHEGDTPLLRVCRLGYFRMVRPLIYHGAKMNTRALLEAHRSLNSLYSLIRLNPCCLKEAR